jgi:VWFA-related protein
VLAASTVAARAQTVREKVSVDLISVRVTARDALGHRVDNLKTSDFQLTVDGKVVPIDALSGPLNLVDEPGVAKPTETPAPAPPAAPPASRRAAGEPLVRTFIFVDETQSNPFDRKDVCEGLARYVRTAAGPGNEFLVARFDGRLHQVTGWTSDGEVVARALQAVADRGQIEHVPGPSTLGANTGTDSFFSAEWIPLYSDLVQRAILESLTTLPQTGGRGRLMLVTNGTTVVSPDELALGTNPDLLTSNPTLSPRYGQSSGMTFAVHDFEDSRTSFQRWSRAVNPHGQILTTVDVLAKAVEYGVEFIPVYTEAVDRGDFDISGMMAPLGHDPGQTGMSVPTAGDGRLSPHLVTAAALENIAEQTGAEAVGNGRNVAARMAQIDERASYLLTFRDPSPDHAYHSITLKSLRPGLKIVYRRSYRLPGESERKLDTVVAGFLTPGRTDTLMSARIEQSPAIDSKNRPATLLGLAYAPPLETGAADDRGVQLIAVGRDSDGNLTEPIEWTGTAQRTGDEARFDAAVMLDVAPKYAWSIAVTDQPTGLTSYVFVPASGSR